MKTLYKITTTALPIVLSMEGGMWLGTSLQSISKLVGWQQAVLFGSIGIVLFLLSFRRIIPLLSSIFRKENLFGNVVGLFLVRTMFGFAVYLLLTSFFTIIIR